MRAADAINLIDAGEFCGREHQWVEHAAGRRHHHHDPRHAGDLGRHRIHQHRGRIGGSAAGHIKADRVDRRPARAELDTERIGEAIVPRHLPAMKNLDAVAGEFERVERGRRAVIHRGGDFFRGHSEPGPVEIEPIEFLRVLLQRPIATRDDVGDDGAHRRFDIRGRLAFAVEKSAELLRKIGRACVEADRHGLTCRVR